MKDTFKERFGDSQEKLHAQQALREGIVMKGYDMDTYVAQFEELVRKAGYDYKEPQVIDLFTNGIEGTLFEMCIDMEKPHTYQEWCAALERVLVIRRKLKACRPELSRSLPPSNTPSLSSLDGERSEDNDEESLAEERTLEWLEEPEIEDPEEGQSWPAEALEYADSSDEAKEEEYVELPQEEEDYQESFEFEVEEELRLAQENAKQNAKTPDKAVEYVQLPSSHKIKHERRQKKKVRFQNWDQEFKTPPAKVREQYMPEDLAPARTPSRWEQQVQHARQELTTAQTQGPSMWAQYRFHPEAMDQSARVRVRQGESRLRMAHIEEVIDRPQVCYHCRLPGHVHPLCPNRGQPRARKSRRQTQKMPGEATIRRAQEQSARPAEKQPTVPPPVVRARKARWEALVEEARQEENAVMKRWQKFEEEDPELFKEVRRRGLYPADVSSSPTASVSYAGASPSSGGVQRGRCPRKEGNVTCAPAQGQRQHAKSHRLSRAEDAEEAKEWIKSEDGITEKMTGPNGVYVRYVSAPTDDEEQDYAVRAGAMIT